MKYIVVIGRVLYALIFITSGSFHFTDAAADYASSQGVPAAPILVPLAGVMAIVGGLSILLGFKARWGAWIIVLFLVPVTLMMHRYWALDDPMQRQIQMAMFMKNTSMLGAALLIAWFGAGPVSVDERASVHRAAG